MKKIFYIAFVAFGLFGFNQYTLEKSKDNNPDKIIEVIDTADCKYGQCLATAKSTKKQCKHCVSNRGDDYCWQHK